MNNVVLQSFKVCVFNKLLVSSASYLITYCNKLNRSCERPTTNDNLKQRPTRALVLYGIAKPNNYIVECIYVVKQRRNNVWDSEAIVLNKRYEKT